MPGFTNITHITLDNITEIANSTSYANIMIKVNHTIYEGWLYFILLWLLCFIIFRAAESKNPDFLRNAMYSFTAATLVSFFMRAITMVREGIIQGLVTDHQLWIFPILTILFALIILFVED